MKKTLISLAAAATLAIGLSTAAKADGIGIGFGVGPYGGVHVGVGLYSPGYYAPGYYSAGYEGCGYRWVDGWYRFHHHMVLGPHRVWTCGY